MPGLRIALTLVPLLVIAGVEAPVTAQDADDLGRRHFQAGESYYGQSRYDDAAREFMEAYRLSGRVVLLINASRAYERALDFDRAIETLERYLELAPAGDDNRPIQEERIEALRQLRERAAGGPRRAPEGSGEGDGPDAAGPTSSAPATTRATGGLGTLGIVGIVGMGLGLATGGAAVGTGVAAHGTFTDLEAMCTADGRCPMEAQSDIDSGSTLAATSTALTFVGLGLSVAGAVLFILDLLEDDDEAPPRVSVLPAALIPPDSDAPSDAHGAGIGGAAPEDGVLGLSLQVAR